MDIKRAIAVSAVSALAFVAACPGDSTSPDNNNGAFSFTFAGSGDGSFNATGALPTSSSDLGTVNAAGGAKQESNTRIGVLGVKARTAGRFDMAFLVSPRITAGSDDINVSSCDPSTSNCAEFVYLTNVSSTDLTYDLACALATGTVTITSVTDTRVQGSYGGVGACRDVSNTITSFTIASGTFDVPLLAALPNHPSSP